MTENGKIEIAKNNGVARITISHPKGNSMPSALLSELANGFRNLGSDPEVTVIILASAGDKIFCSGASFEELLSIKTEENGVAFFSGFAEVITSMITAPKLIIAQVQGKAIGGGVGLIAACDYAIAQSAASIKLSEFSIGFGPFIIGPIVERKIGRSNFQGMTIDTDWRDSFWCKAHGLFHRLVETHAELTEQTEALATQISLSNPDASLNLKKIFWSDLPNLSELLKERTKITAKLAISTFAQNKVAALQKKQ
ncbi:MAG: enoyl-CoA hydratase/isomerase family protein [bacterium]|nr:enoyl-CoA hydratase/isomerase family protein [bacterium]